MKKNILITIVGGLISLASISQNERVHKNETKSNSTTKTVTPSESKETVVTDNPRVARKAVARKEPIAKDSTLQSNNKVQSNPKVAPSRKEEIEK